MKSALLVIVFVAWVWGSKLAEDHIRASDGTGQTQTQSTKITSLDDVCLLHGAEYHVKGCY